MRARRVSTLLVALAISNIAYSDEWDAAERAIARLSPERFVVLPATIKNELKERGCTIPQYWSAKAPGNVVSGSFAKAGQKDYAVLCSKHGESEIQIFWGGPAPCPSTLSKSLDRDYLQVIEPGRIGYSRAIGAAGTAAVRKYQESFGGPKAPSDDHDGIENEFLEKASTIYYCHQGSWMKLQGAD
jgi:hypothetical protein